MDQIRHKSIQTQKMSKLGELAEGIAHELNQPLQLILGFARELNHREPLSPAGKALMEEIENASLHMAGVIRQIREFHRAPVGKNLEISITQTLEGMTTLWRHALLEKGIDLSVKAEPGLPLVQADPTQLSQVFINLISNAKDAIEEAQIRRGKIEIRVSYRQPNVLISIRDNGIGMDERTQKMIFKSRFSTKDPRHGSGLGLHLCRRFLKKMNATIAVQSRSGEGTLFQIEIPALKNERKGETHESN